MNALQISLTRAARELGIEILINSTIDLNENCKFIAPILFPNFGTSKGTIVFSSEETYRSEQLDELWNLGFTHSSFLPPDESEKFDLTSHIEMFSDWGWTGSEDSRPKWLLEQDQDDSEI
jgi:hypothetical protein